MSGSTRAPDSFDERVPLAEALERALGHDDEPSSLTAPVPVPAELARLIELVRRVERSAQEAVEPSDTFRLAARTRLVATMRASAASQIRQPGRQPWRLRLAVSGWFARLAAAFSAVALAGAATASASASALPGDPLYGLKQATEQVALVTAPDDATRQQVLVRQADTRLEETSRLLEQGRDAEASQTALRYGEGLERATAIVGTTEPVETSLQTDRVRLASLLTQAPPPARPGLQRALEAVDRGLARTQRDAHAEVDAQPQLSRPAVVQPARDARLGPTPTSTTSPSPTTPGPGASGDPATPSNADESADAAQRHEPQADQSRRDRAPETIEDGHAADGAASPVSPPERPASSVPAVDKAHGAPVTPVRPPRPGRP